ncbi:hypothetical protein Q9233_017130 [Columba guinea]|nr:hypothetical protein Q9233_017130 [Columba guinea]
MLLPAPLHLQESEFEALRLENSDGCSGRLQVFYNGTWGSVCSNSMTPDTVSLVCKELGCGDGGSLETDLPYGRVSGTAWLDYVQCGEGNISFWQCPSAPWDPQSCDYLQEETHITCNDPTRGRPTVNGRISVPVIICIILGALLCLLLALLARQALRAKAGRRGSRTAQELFPEAVYEEIGHSPAWEKQARFGHSGSSSEQSLIQLQPYPGHREEEDGLGSAPDVPVLPGGDPVDGYDDAREVSLPGEDDAPGQEAREMPRVPEEGAGPSNAPRGLLLPWSRGQGQQQDVAISVLVSPHRDTGFVKPAVELERRIDVKLREGLVESRYWSAATSHTAYWSSVDITLSF